MSLRRRPARSTDNLRFAAKNIGADIRNFRDVHRRIFRAYANAHPLTADSAGVEQENVRLFLQRNRWRACCPSGRVGWPRRDTVRDIVLKYPIWQEPYRAAVIETNPKLLKQKIAGAEQAAILRLKQLENSADNHGEVIALTDALTALRILGETIWG